MIVSRTMCENARDDKVRRCAVTGCNERMGGVCHA